VGVRARRATRRWAAAWVALGAAAPARAEEPPPPTTTARAATAPAPARYKRFVELGQSLPSPYAYGTVGITTTAKMGARTSLESSLGGGVGLSSRLWLDGSSGAFKLAPEIGYHSPQLGLNALLVDAPGLELSATTHVTFVSEDRRAVEQIEPGFITVLRLANKLRIDSGLFFDVNPGATTTFGVRVPANLGFQITEHVYAAVTSGVSVSNFADVAGSTSIPAGLTLGWSDKLSSGQSVGVSPSISFPDLIKPGTPEIFWPRNAVFGITVAFVSKL
jgi:hypothetical protein